MDRWDLYERTVQSPALVVAFLRALHGGEPTVLAEDFAGGAALARAWVASVAGGRAIAVDLDREALARARGDARIELVAGDVRAARASASPAPDLVFAGNFSIGELRERDELVRYLRLARARLAPRGVFVADTYGGAAAWRTGAVERSRWIDDRTRIRFAWEQRSADPTTAEVVCALHFRVERAGEVVFALRDAFVYRWRLWSFAELADAAREAGFARTEVRDDLPGVAEAERDDAVRPETSGAAGFALRDRAGAARAARDPDELVIACVVARTE